MTTWTYYMSFLKDLEVKHQQSYTQRMSDWDQYGQTVTQILMIKLMVTMALNYRDADAANRRQAQQATQLLTVLALQFTTPRKVIYRQFDLLFTNVAGFYRDNATTNEVPGIPEDECARVESIYGLFKAGSIDPKDKITVSADERHLPEEVALAMRKVDEADAFEFQDGVDPESPAFKFKNSLSAFRIENNVEAAILDLITRR